MCSRRDRMSDPRPSKARPATRAKRAQWLDQRLDEALLATFPASDPVSHLSAD